ncbi:MAG: CoA transferase [Gammaproteobacteria bacterium]|nr:CoA transferase [Gammaproteobacteria bacterium]
MALPLAHIRVLDLSRVLAGPYCAMVLGDLGAEVIKVERPGSGDDTRHWGPPFVGGESAYYLCCNRNKKSVTINLKSDRGRDYIRGLAAHSDVLIENFLPGTLEEAGLGYEPLHAINPRLVFCSITGFGQDGPYRDVPGYDVLIQAMAGVMSITGDPDGAPMKVGVAISDITSGLFAASAIMAALRARERGGAGERIDISLFDSTLAWLANVGSAYLVTGQVPQRYGNAHATIVPYQAFATREGHIIVAVGNDGQWQRFCAAVGRPDLAADDRFRTNPLRVRHRAVLIPLLEEVLAARPASAWLSRLAEAEVPSGPVNTLDRAFADPQVQARRMVMEVSHPTIGPLRMVGSPIRLGMNDGAGASPPPMLGQHTAEVLHRVLGLSAADIDAARAAGAI